VPGSRLRSPSRGPVAAPARVGRPRDGRFRYRAAVLHGRRWQGTAVVALAVGLLTACSGSLVRPPSGDPVPVARRFCTTSARDEIARSLGVAPVRVTAPVLHDHHFGCRYEYADGEITIGVTGHRDTRAARAQLASIARTRGRRSEPPMMGEKLEAFVATDGSMVVRAERDVLDVDVSHLPAEFGRPPQLPSVIALAVAVTILGHWVPG